MLTLKINRVPDTLKNEVCTKFGHNPLKDVDSRVFTRMLRKDGQTDGSVTISLRNVVVEGMIIKSFD
jgi:carbamoylphosphate synthase small subunit